MRTPGTPTARAMVRVWLESVMVMYVGWVIVESKAGVALMGDRRETLY